MVVIGPEPRYKVMKLCPRCVCHQSKSDAPSEQTQSILSDCVSRLARSDQGLAQNMRVVELEAVQVDLDRPASENCRLDAQPAWQQPALTVSKRDASSESLLSCPALPLIMTHSI